MKKQFISGCLIGFFLLLVCMPVAGESIEQFNGDALLAEGKYTEAIAAYEEELSTTGDSANVYNNLATAYYQTGDVEKAIESLKLATEVSPDNGMPWLNLGMLYEAIGDLDAAKIAYTNASNASEPIVAANGYLGYAFLCLQENDAPGALLAFESALAAIDGVKDAEYQEMRTQIYDEIGYIYAIAGDNEAAFDAFAAATQTGTVSPIPWMYLASFLEGAGLNDQALLMYQEAIDRDTEGITRAQEAYDSLAELISTSAA
jgi:tetratricopeptide (TPR) repeat protein